MKKGSSYTSSQSMRGKVKDASMGRVKAKKMTMNCSGVNPSYLAGPHSAGTKGKY